jgi:hypothetical protein
MTTDKEVAVHALDMQARARDYGLIELPAYMAWSERKIAEGESEALIANLDARCIWLRPEQVPEVGEAKFEELLADLKAEMGE